MEFRASRLGVTPLGTNPANCLKPVPPLIETIRQLYRWAKAKEFSGHDPHDLLLAPMLRKLGAAPQNSGRLLRLIALQTGRRSAVDLHQILAVPTTQNPKALALFLSGLLQAREHVTTDWEADAGWIAELLVSTMHHSGWGYPFPWQSRSHYIPTAEPNIVTTAFVGMALIEWQRHAASSMAVEAIAQAAEFVSSLSVSAIPSEPEHDSEVPFTAFGYARGKSQIVLNASLLGAEFLLKAGRLLGVPEYETLAHGAARFVARHARADGGWNYGLEPSQRWTDSFHTGFIIRALKSLAEGAGDSYLATSAAGGFAYYRKTFLEPDFAVRYFPTSRYPVDAHAMGEAMLTFETFGDHTTAERIARWANGHLRSPLGYFYYQRRRLYTNRIPYMRWSNAWIFRGLAEVLGSGANKRASKSESL